MAGLLLARRRRLAALGGAEYPAWLSEIIDAAGGEVPTLAIDFTEDDGWLAGAQAAIADLLDCTRASDQYAPNSSGALELFSSNVLPYTDLGLFCPETRTNLFLNSAAPVTQNVTVSAVPYTLSFYGTGSIALSGVSTDGPLVGSGGPTERVSLTFTPSAGTLTLTVTDCEKVQLEAGAFATSYVATGGSAATRALNNIVLDNAAQTAASLSLSQGTWLLEWTDFTAPTSLDRQLICMAVNSSNKIELRAERGASNDVAFVTSATALSAGLVQSDNNPSANTPYKMAAAYSTNDLAAAFTASLAASVNTDATAGMPSGTFTTTIGSRGAAMAANAVIRRIAWWSQRISNSNLSELVA